MNVNSVLNDYNNSTNNVKKSTETSSNKVSFTSYMSETKSLDSIFEDAARKYKVPVDLLKAIGKAESNFDPNAVSSAGAQGVMQLMPATAKYLGVQDSFDPEQNIMGGAKYISQLLDKYDGDVKLSLAAYNAGMGNVAKYGGIPPFKETQNYVVKVMKYRNEGGSAGNATVSVPSNTNVGVSTPISYQNLEKANQKSEASSKVSQELELFDEIFSMVDYNKFLELCLLDNKDEEKEKDKELQSNYLASKSISYNLAFMNLLKG